METNTTINQEFNIYNFEKPDDLFNKMILSHGVGTGFDDKVSSDVHISRIKDLLDKDISYEWQICCSSKYQLLGEIGVYCKGTNIVVSNIDLYSKRLPNGKRYFEYEDYEPANLENYNGKNIFRHVEHIVEHVNVIGIWVKGSYLRENDVIDTLHSICNEHGLLLHVVDK